MNALTKDEKNRKIAEWLGFRVTGEAKVDLYHQFFTWHAPDCNCSSVGPEDICSCLDLCSDGSRDFYIDEAANALALDSFIENAPAPKITNLTDFIAGCRLTGEKRRTAICAAFLTWKENLETS